jgi:hypothetical protein
MQRTKTTNQSATACYGQPHTECQDLPKRIECHLERHAAREARQPADCGYAGDVGRVAGELAYVLASLGNRSPVEQRGLEY